MSFIRGRIEASQQAKGRVDGRGADGVGMTRATVLGLALQPCAAEIR